MRGIIDNCGALTGAAPRRHRKRVQPQLGICRATVSRVCVLLCAGSVWAISSAVSANAQQEDLQGIFDIDISSSDDIGAVITRGTAQMNFMTRPLARRLIAQANPAYRQIAISLDSATVVIRLDEGRPITTPLNGNPVRWIREDGQVDRVTANWAYPTFIMRFEAEDGQRTHRYVLDPGGQTFKLYVELTSSHLPGPIDYMLAYKRRSTQARN
jgi:hypothetical protein